MPFVNKLVMHGFKSFATKTEIIFDKGMNVIVGPNGSGKSNITDALCFVLGRLSIKSMRAAKAANLIFGGAKDKKPAGEATVEISFDNSDKGFPSMGPEVTIKRAVRRNGQSLYKINNDVKTRQEIIELLAVAGIDPHGFNIVLQGEITTFVKMRPDERRKVIEEVAGISVYEVRKERSLHELEKTEEKLKEINAILRERTAYLRNLEEERKQALKFKELETLVKRCKASILRKDIQEKEKENQLINQDIDKISQDIQKLKQQAFNLTQETMQIEEKIKGINQSIQSAGGKDQEILNHEISELKAELAGLNVRKENFENQITEIKRRNQEMLKNIKDAESKIEERRKGDKDFSGEDLKKRKLELADTEEKRKKFYSLRSELNSLSERVSDKRKDFQKVKNDAEFTLNQISQLSTGLSVLELKKAQFNHKEIKIEIESLIEQERKIQSETIQLDKEVAVSKSKIDNLAKVKDNITKLDVCPVCKTQVTKEHASRVIKETEDEIFKILRFIEEADQRKRENEANIAEIRNNIKLKATSRDKLVIDISKLENVEEKKNYLSKLSSEEATLRREIEELEKKRKLIERGVEEYRDIEDKYDRLSLEVTELMRRAEEHMGMELTMQERELERMRIIIKKNERDAEEYAQKVKEIERDIEAKSSLLSHREKQEKEQYERFQKMFKDRADLQEKIKEKEKKNFDIQGEVRVCEEKINNFKISKARVDAERESVEIELIEFKDEEIIEGSKNMLTDKMDKAKNTLAVIGNVNLRALQEYDRIKVEYDSVFEKTQTLQKEKEEILKIIEEIDIKKKRTFVKTLKSINELFTRNVSELYTKGSAFLDMENKEDIFAGGLNIIIKVGQGKYFDVSSLSGGEQTLVALSLIFAIQEYKPYAFYIFDEIDAALDKRNSERLAALIKRYMNIGQYIIVTHNDAIITESTTLYGVSMHEGVSKVLSLEV